jgi:hypothetical protein
VVVTRASELEALVARHGTRAQARFYLDRRGRDLAAVERRHALREAALDAVSRAIPVSWRRVRIDRADVARFVFEPEDLVVAVGQDDLVANAAKYLHGREPFPSVATGTTLDGARLGPGEHLELVSEMDEGGVLFADGIEDDRLELPFGARARFEVAPDRLRLVRGG